MTVEQATSIIKAGYQKYLGRQPSQNEINIHLQWKGSVPDWEKTIRDSPEGRAYAARNAPKPPPGQPPPGQPPKPGQPPPSSGSLVTAAIIQQAFQHYLGRPPTAAELQKELAESNNRKETVAQFQARLQNHFGKPFTPSTPSQPGQPGQPSPAGPLPTAAGPNLNKYKAYDRQRVEGFIKQFPHVSPGIVDYYFQQIARNDPSKEGELRVLLGSIRGPASKAGGYTAPNFSQITREMGAPGGDSAGGGSDDPLQRAIQEAILAQAQWDAKIIPGAAPNLGVLPNNQIIDLLTGKPVDKVDAITRAYAKLAAGNKNVPNFIDVAGEIHLSGRGYQFGGDPSPEEQALQARFLAGDRSAAGPLADMRMKRLQVTPRSNPTLDKAMRSLALAFIATGMGAALGPGIGAMLGPATAAGAGGAAGTAGFAGGIGGGTLSGLGTAGLSAGTSSVLGGAAGSALGGAATTALGTHGDWRKVLIGALTSLAGGGAGGLAGKLAGSGVTGGLVGGGVGGLTGSGLKAGLTKALGGEANPWDVLTNTITGALAGGVGSGLTAAGTEIGSDPGGIGNFVIPPDQLQEALIKLASGAAGSNTSAFLKSILPAGETGFAPEPGKSPFPSQETMDRFGAAAHADQMAMQREGMAKQLAEFERKKSEYMAARDAAYEKAYAEFGQRKAEYLAKVAEYQAKVDQIGQQRREIIERLRGQALEQLKAAYAARSRPLPPIPVPQGPATPPAPDPFGPSAILASQQFAPGADFPTSKGAGGQTSDFPISGTQPGTVATSANAPRARASTRQLPLNIKQIQAALSARRRT